MRPTEFFVSLAGTIPLGRGKMQWQKTTNIKGVEVALGGATPEQQHQAWVDHKVKDGWVYGEVKDPEQKTHPCLVPYPDLPAFQKAKDDLYIAVANAMYKALTT
jgi:hypothetical protein